MRMQLTGWVVHVAHMGMTNMYTVSVCKLEVKSPLRKPRRRWKDNIKMATKERRIYLCACIGFIWLKIGTSVRAVVYVVTNTPVS
jgi:hypothetical protein